VAASTAATQNSAPAERRCRAIAVGDSALIVLMPLRVGCRCVLVGYQGMVLLWLCAMCDCVESAKRLMRAAALVDHQRRVRKGCAAVFFLGARTLHGQLSHACNNMMCAVKVSEQGQGKSQGLALLLLFCGEGPGGHTSSGGKHRLQAREAAAVPPSAQHVASHATYTCGWVLEAPEKLPLPGLTNFTRVSAAVLLQIPTSSCQPNIPGHTPPHTLQIHSHIQRHKLQHPARST